MALSWQNLGWNGIPLSQLFATVPAAYRDLSMPIPSLHSLANDFFLPLRRYRNNLYDDLPFHADGVRLVRPIASRLELSSFVIEPHVH